MQFYMLINLAIVAYVTTTTLLVITTADATSRRRREAEHALRAFAHNRNLYMAPGDPRLWRNMRSQLELRLSRVAVRPSARSAHCLRPYAPCHCHDWIQDTCQM